MRRRLIAGATVGALVLALWLLLRSAGDTDPYPVPGEDGVNVLVEVLNGTDVDGLARRTTRHLRRRGVDVVYFGSAAEDTFTTTVILARGTDSTDAIRVRRALGLGVVRVEPNPSLLLDVSVILGFDAPAALDLDP